MISLWFLFFFLSPAKNLFPMMWDDSGTLVLNVSLLLVFQALQWLPFVHKSTLSATKKEEKQVTILLLLSLIHIHSRQKCSVSQSRYKKQLGSRGQTAMMSMANLCLRSHLQAETDIPSHIPSRYTNDSFLVKLGSSRASSSSSSTSGAGESPPSPPVINPLLLSTTPMPISQFAYAAAASGKATLNF